MRKNVNWPYVAGLFESRGCIETCISSDNPTQVGSDQIGIQHPEKEIAQFLLDALGGLYHDDYDPDGYEVYIWKPKGRKNKLRFLTGIYPFLKGAWNQKNVQQAISKLQPVLNSEVTNEAL